MRPILEKYHRLPIERIAAAHHREPGVGQDPGSRPRQAADLGVGGYGVGTVQQRFLAVPFAAAVDCGQQIQVERLWPPPCRHLVQRGRRRHAVAHLAVQGRCRPAVVAGRQAAVWQYQGERCGQHRRETARRLPVGIACPDETGRGQQCRQRVVVVAGRALPPHPVVVGAGVDLVVKAELAMHGVVANRVVAGHGRGRAQRGNVPALDVVHTSEALLFDMRNRSVKQIPLHHPAVRGSQILCYQVVAARQPHDEVRFVQRLVGGLAAAVAAVGAIGSDRVVGIAPGIAGQHGRRTPQARRVSGQPPAQRELHCHPRQQQVGSKPPCGVEAAPGHQLSVHRTAMYVGAGAVRIATRRHGVGRNSRGSSRPAGPAVQGPEPGTRRLRLSGAARRTETVPGECVGVRAARSHRRVAAAAAQVDTRNLDSCRRLNLHHGDWSTSASMESRP